MLEGIFSRFFHGPTEVNLVKKAQFFTKLPEILTNYSSRYLISLHPLNSNIGDVVVELGRFLSRNRKHGFQCGRTPYNPPRWLRILFISPISLITQLSGSGKSDSDRLPRFVFFGWLFLDHNFWSLHRISKKIISYYQKFYAFNNDH